VKRILWASVAVLCACSHDRRIPLVVYSPHGQALLADFAQRFEKAHPDIDVQWVDMGAQEVIDRLRAESVNPQADVWFGGPETEFTRAAKESLLAAYTPTWADYVPSEARDSADQWFGTYLTPEVIAYNSAAVPDSAAPKDWDDVLDPKWKGKLLIRDPVESGSMRAIFGAILARSITATGSTAAGWNWLRRLDANTKEYVLNPTLLYQKLGRQEGVITLWDMPDIAVLQERMHIPIKYKIPVSGTPLLVEGIAIVKGAKHPAAAKAYYEFVTSPAMLLLAAREQQRIPVRTDLPDDSMPDWIRAARREIKPMPVNRALLADSLDDWMTYWDSNIRRRG
jgi:iron(III) transport system substrate-binding protein